MRRGVLEEDVSVLFSVTAFDIFSQRERSGEVGGLSWEDLLEKPEDLSDCEPETRVGVSVVPDVTDVNVSPSSEVTAFRDGFSFCSAWESVEPQSFSFSKSVLTLGQLSRKR